MSQESDINAEIRRRLRETVGDADDYTVAVTRVANDMIVIANRTDPNIAWPGVILLLVSIARSYDVPFDQLQRAVAELWRQTESNRQFDQIEPS